MERKASDNAYLHKDFHSALNQALIYLEQNFGAGAVREYLHQFARTFYSPLSRDLKERGLEALKTHLEKLYKLEGAKFSIKFSPDELILSVDACPAVGHIRKMGLPVSPQFSETTRTVNAAICEGTGYEFELLEYDPESGRRVERYTRRHP
ncbi:MAG: hypothetical protein A2W03_12290 [Candidatus Aminicenantes bacterium RBG_16_63_16]|nr:MAG: hypothetical protein A2W03_12290 [Candidatus Aminicenantes bacterium RBG_16_63_16]